MANKLNFFTLLIFYSLLNLTLTVSKAGPIESPETPAEKRAQEIISLLNGTFPRPVEDYIQNDYAPEFRDSFALATHKQFYTTTQTMFGHLILADIGVSTPSETQFTLGSKSGEAWINIHLWVEADPPHRITSLGVRPGAKPVSSNTKDAKNANPEQNSRAKTSSPPLKKPNDVDPNELHKMISDKVEKNEYSGVVLIARDGRPLFHRAYGYASKRFKVPNYPDTRFNLGSINKSFTAVAIAQLAEQGKLAFDDPIGKFLNIFPSEIASKVKIQHLLNMRSGWGDFWGNEAYLASFPRLRTVSDYMEFIKDMPLDFEPGTNFKHSNTGFEVAGAIIEAQTGMDYYTYVRTNIYDPAGMAASDSYHKDGPVENLAIGYTNMNRDDPDGTGYNWENTYMIPPRGTPAGGGYSTAGDLLKYANALRNNTLMGKLYTEYLFSQFKGQLGDPFTPGMYRAVGGAPGINAYVAMDLVCGYTFVVLSNFDPPAAMSLAEEIIKMYGLK